MAQQKSGGVTDNVRDALAQNPAIERLLGEVETYMRNRATGLVDSLGGRISDTAERLEGFATNGATKTAAKSVAKGDSPLKAGAKAVGTGVKDKVTGMLGSNGSGGGDSQKATIIAESIEVGVPVSVAYNQWTQFREFGRFTKGVQSVNQDDEVTTNWKAKIGFSTRSWNAKITEQIPDQKIAWTSDGAKGSVNGVVTFHDLAPNLTKVLLELEYHPKGLFEKTGNLWRAQGRRARLDLKHFRRFVMMRGEETGAWRGEIRDGEVTRGSDEEERPKQQQRDRHGGETSRQKRAQDDRSARGAHEEDRAGRRSREDDRAGRRPREDDRAGRRSREDDRRQQRSSRPAGSERSERRTRRSGAARQSGRRGQSDEGNSSEGNSSEGNAARRESAPNPRSAETNDTEPARKNPAAKKTTTRKNPPAKRTASKNTPAKKTASKRTPAKKTTARKTTTSATTSAPPRKSTSSGKSTSGRRSASAGKNAPPRKSTSGRSTSAARKTTSTRKTTSARRT